MGDERNGMEQTSLRWFGVTQFFWGDEERGADGVDLF